MKISTKLIIITIILVLVLGFFAYKNIKATGEVILINENKVSQNDSYCEYDDNTGVCGPVGICEFQTDSDGTKICLGKY